MGIRFRNNAKIGCILIAVVLCICFEACATPTPASSSELGEAALPIQSVSEDTSENSKPQAIIPISSRSITELNFIMDSRVIGKEEYSDNILENAVSDEGYLKNPWHDANFLVYNLYHDTNLEITYELLDTCMEAFYKVGYFYLPAYENLEDGWVSSMDAPSICIAAQLAYEKTEIQKYQDYVEDLSAYMLKTVDQHGFLYYWDKDTAWPFEYASKDVTPKNGQFVLNGALVGALGMKIVGDATGNKELLDAYEHCVNGFMTKSEEYWYGESEWSYYMLSPRTENPPHYMEFEILLFRSLAAVDGNEENHAFFSKELQRREQAYTNTLAVYAIPGKQPDTLDFVYMRSSAPHPYFIDVRGSKLYFFDQEGALLSTFEQDGGIYYDDLFLTGEVPTTATTCAVSTGRNLFVLPVQVLPETDPVGARVDYTLLADDAHQTNLVSANTIEIDVSHTDDSEILFSLSPGVPLSASPDKYIGLELENESDKNMNCDVLFYDSNKVGVQRYNKPLMPGKNFILWNILGFCKSDIHLADISRIVIRCYPNEDTPESVILNIGELYCFNNTYDIYSYMEKSDFKVNCKP